MERLTIAWLAVELLVSLWVALSARSIALLAFGLDSGIELVSAGVLLWRLGVEWRGGEAENVERAERSAAAIVGWSLLLLALYVVASAAYAFFRTAAPAPAPLGIAMAVAALVVMPLLVTGKRRIAHRLDSEALRADAAEGIVCAYMAAVLLAGLLLMSLFGWSWADPLAALGIVYFIVREGIEAIRESRGAED